MLRSACFNAGSGSAALEVRPGRRNVIHGGGETRSRSPRGDRPALMTCSPRPCAIRPSEICRPLRSSPGRRTRGICQLTRPRPRPVDDPQSDDWCAGGAVGGRPGAVPGHGVLGQSSAGNEPGRPGNDRSREGEHGRWQAAEPLGPGARLTETWYVAGPVPGGGATAVERRFAFPFLLRGGGRCGEHRGPSSVK